MLNILTAHSFFVDPLAVFFLAVIGLVTLPAVVFSIGYLRKEFSLAKQLYSAAFLAVFVSSMCLVVTAGNLFSFLFFWELMALSSYLLVVFDYKHEKSIRAGTLYLIMTHIGTAALIAAFFLFYTQAGSLDFVSIKQAAAMMPAGMRNILFLLLLFGFSAKAGVVPLHIWLPSAHPQAPSHISSIMSGAMIKVAVYGMIRFMIMLLGPGPQWWGTLILVLAAVSCLVGVIYALMAQDIKKLLAYSSVENIGIILLGVGASMVFSVGGMPMAAVLALSAGLYHLINHALFKGLLFLGAGSVVKATGLRDMEKMGGLIKTMPWTAVFFLIGAMGISALPPLNGFVSEWLTFQAFFAGILQSPGQLKIVMFVCAAVLALTSGLAAACFVKAFGITFLAMPRSQRARQAQEVGLSLKAGMGFLAVLVVLFGLGAGAILPHIAGVAQHALGIPGQTVSFQWWSPYLVSVPAAGVSPLVLAALLLAAGLVIAGLFIAGPLAKTSRYHTWDCGYYALDSRTEYTSTAFSKPFRIAFSFFLLPYRKSRKLRDSFYHVRSFTYETHTTPVFEQKFYEPLLRVIYAIAFKFRKVQPGIINLYLLYIFLTVIILVALTGFFNL